MQKGTLKTLRRWLAEPYLPGIGNLTIAEIRRTSQQHNQHRHHRASRSTTATTRNTTASGSSGVCSHASLIPVDCSPAHPAVVVLIQSIPAYIPTARPYENTFQHAAAAADPPHKSHHYSIIKRFSSQDGGVVFTVQSPGDGAVPGNEIEVDLENIYDYVSPAELERYENLDWERDDERRRNRPKVGRPRKTSPSGATLAISHNKPKRPLGRPRKYPIVTKTQGPAGFAGVHIATPVKPSLAPQSPSPKSSPAAQHPDQVGSQRRVPTASAVESVSSSESDPTPLNIDQVTPSNARKVVAARPPEPSPSKNSRRTTYSMVEASLGRCDISDEENVIPDSGSEDELSFIPSAREARFASKTEISNSTPDVDEHHDSVFLSGPESSDNQAVTQPNDQTSKVHSVHDGLSSTDGIVDSDEPSDLLQQVQAKNAPRIKSKSSSARTSDLSKSKPIYKYFQPKASVKDVVAYPSLFKGHQTVPTSPTWKGLVGNAAELKDPSGRRSHIKEPASGPAMSHAQQFPTEISPVRPRNSQHPKSPSADPNAARKSTQAANRAKPQASRPARKSLTPHFPSAQLGKPSTPPTLLRARKTMTPHFPSSKKSTGQNTSTRLRGGMTKAPFSTKSPIKASHPNRAPPRPSSNALILQNRDRTRTFPTSLANGHTNDDLITLGSPLTTSDASSVHDRDHLSAIDLPPPRSSAPDITLGSPLTSSSEDTRTKPFSSSSMFTFLQNTNTNHRTKRRRSSGGSGNEGARYDRLVRR
ncbi:MAG: hypothetical protein L6R35_002360 [Caloplaca aegaea]|nr:MAG: hypothetical protein L6R35_002360 [Caloplaca aegaea]